MPCVFTADRLSVTLGGNPPWGEFALVLGISLAHHVNQAVIQVKNMAKSSSKSNRSSSSNPKEAIDAPWLSRPAGLKIMAVVSIGLAIYTGWQVYPAGLGTAILWGLGSAAAIWAVFGISYLFNVLIRPRNR